jgi:hypothetical protein
MVEAHGSDPDGKDLARVLRRPGSWHQKGEPHQVRIVGGCEARYGRDELIKAFPPPGAAQARSQGATAHVQWPRPTRPRALHRPTQSHPGGGLGHHLQGWPGPPPRRRDSPQAASTRCTLLWLFSPRLAGCAPRAERNRQEVRADHRPARALPRLVAEEREERCLILRARPSEAFCA